MDPVKPDEAGHITTEQAAALCGVKPVTVRNWILRGYVGPDGKLAKLPVAGRYKRRLLLDPVEVAKAEHATAPRARRMITPGRAA